MNADTLLNARAVVRFKHFAVHTASAREPDRGRAKSDIDVLALPNVASPVDETSRVGTVAVTADRVAVE